MPVIWDAATYAAMYKLRIRDPAHPQFGQTVGYGRTFAQRCQGPYDDALTWAHTRRDNLLRLFPGMTTSQRYLIAGCGFGYLIESFKTAGFPNVWGIDNSAYVSANRATQASGDVLWVADDLRGGARVRNALRDLTGANTFDWILSESVMESYTDAEVPQMLNAAESVLAPGRPLSNITHLVVDDPGILAPCIARTLAQYNALRTAHSWVSLVNWAVL